MRLIAKTKIKSHPIDPYASNEEPEIASVSWEETEYHLRAFIESFIFHHDQQPWLELLIEKRAEWNKAHPSERSTKLASKARECLNHIGVGSPYWSPILPNQRTTAHYHDTFGIEQGVYIELWTPLCKMTALKANTMFNQNNSSAILSFEAGKRILYFCHNVGIWKGEKRS